MIEVLGAMALLGLAAVDPVGIAIMPLLLAQRRPYLRALSFLGGSFVALVVMGIVFAEGAGHPLVRFQQHHIWMFPLLYGVAAACMFGLGIGLAYRVWNGKPSSEVSARMRGWLELGSGRLFAAGAALVAVQSVIDVVFVVAMVRLGELRSVAEVVGGVMTYALAALILQLAVVVAFAATPPITRNRLMQRLNGLLDRYASRVVCILALGLGVVFLIATIKTQAY